jgi:hypothetical protein
MSLLSDIYLSTLTRTPFLAHSTANEAAMCLTAEAEIESMRTTILYISQKNDIPAFEAL